MLCFIQVGSSEAPKAPPGSASVRDAGDDMDRVKRIWYLSPMRAAKVQASLRICAVSPEPSLLAHKAVSQEEPSDRKPDLWPSECLGMRS